MNESLPRAAGMLVYAQYPQDPRVQRNKAYLVIILLSRVITKLGEIRDVSPGAIENMFSSDLVYLQDFYRRINSNGHSKARMLCPECDNEFDFEEQLLNGGNGLEG